MNSQAIREKVSRIASGAQPRVLDLFAGCGGLSLGFKSAGYEIVGSVENDPIAAASHGLNFHPGKPSHAIARDITDTNPVDLFSDFGLGSANNAVDVIVGGPPCQAFARVGRPKLREIADHPTAFKQDPRAQLYLHYLEYVRECEPLALLMENVPDVLNHGGQNIAEEVCETLESMGYIARYTLLNSAFYGVPQMRERMFLIGYHESIAAQVTMPEPSHWLELPRGYEGSRQVALRMLRKVGLFDDPIRYVAPPQATPDLTPAVSAQDAIGDLPRITTHLEGKLRRGARRFDSLVKYDRRRRVSGHARQMKEWSGYESEEGVYDHVIRYLPRDWKIFARMKPGDQYPEAHALANRMFQEELTRQSNGGRLPAEGTKKYEQIKAEFVPPYDPHKFPNKWRKMWPDQPARTLMAHLGKDSYSHIHYDSSQSRTISVREAARLQSFPDGFVFKGTMNPAFRQIGNAVPPLLAAAIAREILDVLSGATEEQNNVIPRTTAAI